MKVGFMAAMLLASPAFGQPSIQDQVSTDSATAFVNEIFSAWSGPDAASASAIDGFLADTVNFYGSVISAQKVESIDTQFAKRWAVRSYKVTSFSKADCDQPTSTCVVSGTVHWDDQARGPNLHSVGDADFSFSLKYIDGQYKIAGENEKVLDRKITPEAVAVPPPLPMASASSGAAPPPFPATGGEIVPDAQDTPSPPPSIIIQALVCKNTPVGPEVEGQLQNQIGSDISYVELTVIFKSTSDAFVSTSSIMATYNPVLAGQVSPFDGYGGNNPQVGYVEVTADVIDGASLPTSGITKAQCQ